MAAGDSPVPNLDLVDEVMKSDMVMGGRLRVYILLQDSQHVIDDDSKRVVQFIFSCPRSWKNLSHGWSFFAFSRVAWPGEFPG